MRSAGVHHFDVVVSGLDRSLEFCRGLLGPPGHAHAAEIVGERGELVVHLGGPGLVPVSLPEVQSPAATTGTASAFTMLHSRRRRAKSSTSVPSGYAREPWRSRAIRGDTPTCMSGSYAGFFCEPDCIKLEIVHAL